MATKVPCPNPSCGKIAVLPDKVDGRTFRCGSCRARFEVRADGRARLLIDPTVAADPAPVNGAPQPTASFADGQCGPAVAVTPPPSAGVSTPSGALKRVGRFEVRAPLGAGAFGVVYRAFDPQLQREVALKVPHPGTLDSPRKVERFLREARAAAGLHHPHIVPVFDAGEADGQRYIASAFIAGRSLEAAADEKAMDYRRAARIVKALAEALAYAHGEGVVHRDVKPANVLLDDRDQPHLLDFGLAHHADAARLTRDGSVLGTPAYMAPEVALSREGDPLPASDQYALGATLYELLTGRTPFTGPPQAILVNVVRNEPPTPRKLNPTLPRDLETICLKAMSKEPRRRYADCASMADDLGRFLRGEPVLARPVGILGRTWRWSGRNPAVASLVGTVAATLLLGAAVAGYFAVQAELKANEARSEAKAKEEQRKEALNRKEEAERQRQEADAQRERARQESAEAEKQRREAEAQKARAEALLGEKERQRQEAEAQRARAEELVAEKERQRQEAETQRARAEAEIRRANSAKSALKTSLLRRVEELGQSDPQAASKLLRNEEVYPPPERDFAWGVYNRWCLLGGREAKLERVTLKVLTGECSRVAFSPDGKTLAAGGNAVRMWSVASGEEHATLKGHTNWVSCVAFSPDGKTLVSGSWDQTIKLWDAQSGQERATLEGHTAQVHCVAFSPDGKTLASASGDNTIKLWDAASGQKRATLRGHTGSVWSVAFSPDGKTLASAGDDITVGLWDAASGQERATLLEHTGPVHCVAFSPDGKTLAAGSGHPSQQNEPGEIKLWDTRSGQERATLRGHTGIVKSVAFSPDGKTLASGSWDQTIKLWDATFPPRWWQPASRR